MNLVAEWLSAFNTYVGSYLVMVMLVPMGLVYTFGLKFVHIRYLKHTINVIRGKYDREEDQGEISHFRALTTALAATVGTGNIVGVALAIYWGGPGALFWMWVTGFLGMATKMAECMLGHACRVVEPSGRTVGGPMYYMEKELAPRLGIFAKVLAVIFAVSMILSALGSGMVQLNSIADGMKTNYHIPPIFSAFVLVALIFLVLVGEIRRIAAVASRILPIMAIWYCAGALVIILTNIDRLLPVLGIIVHDAFTGTAAAGGFVGSTFLVASRYGVARGLFSNEAGVGAAAVAHSVAKTKWSAREGLVASIGPLVDTLIICSLTGLAILLSGAWDSGLKGVEMTSLAFQEGLAFLHIPWLTQHIVPIALLLFAFSTALAYAYYGERALEYLAGKRWNMIYRWIYCGIVFGGTLMSLKFVWNFIDMSFAFMTLSNVVALIILFPKVRRLTMDYLSNGLGRIQGK